MIFKTPTFIPVSSVVGTQGQKMRPTIPEMLQQQMEMESEEFTKEDEDGNKVPMKLYEVGGASSKGDFVRYALKEKLQKMRDEHEFTR